MSKNKKEKNPRLGLVGGQAVLEGVMMRSGENVSLAVRQEDGNIAVKNSKFISFRKKHKICNIPILRGTVNFIEMMKMSFSTIEDSAAMLGMDELDEETKFDKWVKKKLGDKVMKVVMAFSTVIGVALSIGLFVLLPMWITSWIKSLCGLSGEDITLTWGQNLLFSLISGLVRILIFIGYMVAVSFMKDIRRTFEYHGAEHKSIACFEAGMELTPANAKKCTRFHPRCGTSFIFVILIISILIFSIVPWTLNKYLMLLIRLALMPVVMGVGFELLMLSGKHPNKFTLALALPGLWMQRITTKEPDEQQLEVAITALKCAMPDTFPEVKDIEEWSPGKKKETAENSEETEDNKSAGQDIPDADADNSPDSESPENTPADEAPADEESGSVK